MNILRMAKVPPVTIESSATIAEAIRLMEREEVGSVLVVDRDQLKGTLGERDIMLRVAVPKKDPETTRVSEVMTKQVWTISKDTTVQEAVRIMRERHIRHLPIINRGKVAGSVSLRHMLREEVEGLNQELDSLVAAEQADGIGG